MRLRGVAGGYPGERGLSARLTPDVQHQRARRHQRWQDMGPHQVLLQRWEGSCQTGDCAGALSCSLSGQPPATLAEYTIGGGGANDFYDISVIDGYNLPTDFSCSTGVALRCRESNYPGAYHHPNDVATHGCNDNNNYGRV
ncbi:hypothetical protein ACQ4PT_043170 [Festuca glaucescens]